MDGTFFRPGVPLDLAHHRCRVELVKIACLLKFQENVEKNVREAFVEDFPCACFVINPSAKSCDYKWKVKNADQDRVQAN